MPRQARINTPYLHIIVRGISKQILFECSDDYIYYLNLLKKYTKDEPLNILAYCLMDNHVHLLIYDPDNNSSRFMKKVGLCYARYFNIKYDRTGHLFQDRFKSENITDEKYLLTVFRYILQNPYKAGICMPENYRWSSYHELWEDSTITQPKVLLSMLGDANTLKSFLSNFEAEECMEYSEAVYSDDELILHIMKKYKISSPTVIQTYDKSRRDSILLELKSEHFSVNQLERVTGISKSIIYRAKM